MPLPSEHKQKAFKCRNMRQPRRKYFIFSLQHSLCMYIFPRLSALVCTAEPLDRPVRTPCSFNKLDMQVPLFIRFLYICHKTHFINQSPFHVLAVSLNMCGCVRARASPISSYSKPSKMFWKYNCNGDLLIADMMSVVMAQQMLPCDEILSDNKVRSVLVYSYFLRTVVLGQRHAAASEIRITKNKNRDRRQRPADSLSSMSCLSRFLGPPL